jgi:hypothetical protein
VRIVEGRDPGVAGAGGAPRPGATTPPEDAAGAADTADVDAAEVDAAEVDTAEVDTAEVDTAEVDATPRAVTVVGTATVPMRPMAASISKRPMCRAVEPTRPAAALEPPADHQPAAVDVVLGRAVIDHGAEAVVRNTRGRSLAAGRSSMESAAPSMVVQPSRRGAG